MGSVIKCNQKKGSYTFGLTFGYDASCVISTVKVASRLHTLSSASQLPPSAPRHF